MALVVVIMADNGDIRAKSCNDIFQQCGLSAATAAGNADHQNIFHIDPLLIQKFMGKGDHPVAGKAVFNDHFPFTLVQQTPRR